MKLVWFILYKDVHPNNQKASSMGKQFAFKLYGVRRIPILILAALLLTLAQCTSDPSATKSANSGLQSDSINNADLALTDILLPSPNEILEEMLIHKQTFNSQLVNLPTNAPKYLNRKQQSVNLGVYLADFAYLTLGTDKANSLVYFKIIRDISQKINIVGDFDQSFFNRLQTNLANNDSILSLSKEVYYNLADIMQEASLPDTYALMSSGAFIESLYLAVMNIPDYNNFKEAANKLFEKKQLLDSYYKFASAYDNYPDVKSILTQLESLKQILDESKTITTTTTVIKNKNNHLTVRGGDEVIVTEPVFNKFKQNIIKIRQDIVNTNSKK